MDPRSPQLLAGTKLSSVAVIGVGRIGLCLILNLERAGVDTLGIDRNRDRVEEITDKTLRTPEPGVEEALRQLPRLAVTTDLGALRAFDPDIVVIAVDTPTVFPAGYDHGIVDRVMHHLFDLAPSAGRKELVVMSTTLPGYCDSKADEALSHGYVLSYNPVFVAQGSIMLDQRQPDQVLIGEADTVAGDKLELLHSKLCINQPRVHRMCRLSAEISKLATNSFLTSKIAFANAIGDLALEVGADPEKILHAVGADARIGSDCLRYGDGFGGPCFPRDNRALSYFAEQHGHMMLLGDAADALNGRHLDFQLKKYLQTVPESEPIHLHCVSYKPGTEIIEESQSLALAERLALAGRTVVIHEREIVINKLQERFGGLFEYQRSAQG